MLKLLEEPCLESIREFKGVFERYEPDQRRVPHEVMSCIFFAKIWHDIDAQRQSPWIPKAVTAAILGKEEAFEKIDSPHNRWVPLARDLVSSAPADADRMDYADVIHERKLWKRIFDLQNQDIRRSGRGEEGKPEAQEIREKVESLHTILEKESGRDTLCLDKVEAKATKDLDKGAAILVPVDNVYTAKDKSDWKQLSPLDRSTSRRRAHGRSYIRQGHCTDRSQ